ncbi:MAG: hypothetical protein U9P49_08790 [Thermodesulfobacteriota bacterium]|nr:hypothetical protein [Thermodesulfobacteriota bacterium]
MKYLSQRRKGIKIGDWRPETGYGKEGRPEDGDRMRERRETGDGIREGPHAKAQRREII